MTLGAKNIVLSWILARNFDYHRTKAMFQSTIFPPNDVGKVLLEWYWSRLYIQVANFPEFQKTNPFTPDEQYEGFF